MFQTQLPYELQEQVLLKDFMMKMAADNKLFSNLQRAAYTQLASVSQRWMMIVTKRPWFAKQLRSVMLSRGVSTIAALNMYIIHTDIMHVVTN